MHFKQIVDYWGPLDHWTFENYASDQSTVFGEYGRNLLNSNATLGAEGQSNHNFSGRAANLKNGHLILPDGNFMRDQIADHDFMIFFSFKTSGVEETGTRALVSKWSPVPQFWIGFENGDLVARIETATAGQVVLTFDDRNIIYNDYWNFVCLLAHSDGTYQLMVNGLITSTNDTTVLVQSDLSQFTIGDPSNPFTNDMYICDVSVQDWCWYINNWPLFTYRFTRSDKEALQGLAPDYLFDFPTYWDRQEYGPIPNEGRGPDVNGYLINKDPGAGDPYTTQVNGEFSARSLAIPHNVFFTIDGDLDFEWAEGVGVMFTRHYTPIDTTSEFGHYDNNLHWNWTYIDIGESKANPDNWRFRMAYMDGSSGEVWGIEAKDGTGSVLSSLGPGAGSQAAYDVYNDFGIFRFKMASNDFVTHHHDYTDWANSNKTHTRSGGMGGYMPTVPLGYNRWFWRDNTDDPVELGNPLQNLYLREMAIFNRNLTDTMINVIQYPKVMLFNNFFSRRFGSGYYFFGLRNDDTPEWRRYNNGTTTNEFLGYGNSQYNLAGLDPLNNRQNEWLRASYFPSTGYYRSQYYNTDDNQLSTNNVTFNFWIRNNNTTSLYDAMFLHYSSSYTVQSLQAGYRLGYAVNAGPGHVFDPGGFLFTTNDWNADYSVYVPDALPDDGWHMVTCVRNGSRMEVWIDGVQKAYKITPTVYNLGTANRAIRIQGGPCYIADWYWDEYGAWDKKTIEFAFRGHGDIIKGQTLLNTIPIKSQLLAVNHITGDFVSGGESDDQGDFTLRLLKDEENRDLDVIALPYDDAATNHVVVHGPYNANTVYSRNEDEVLDQSLKDMILDMEPYAYYPMDDTTGTTIVDASGNGRDGTISGDYLLGQQAMETDSKSIWFGGTNAYIDLPDGFDSFPDGITIELWSKAGATSNWARFVSLATTAESGTNEIRLARNSTTENLNGYANGTTTQTLEAAGAIQNNVWEHYVFRIDLATGIGTMWDSGGQVASASGFTAIPNILRTLNYIGRSNFAADAYFFGNMSHVAIYDYPLPDEDILKHAFRGQSRNHATFKGLIESDNPVAYWTFDRLQGLADEIGNISFNVNGTHVIQKNALVLNDAAVGNNYLYTDQFSLAPTDTNFSIEFGFKCPTTQTDAVLVSQWDEAGNDGSIKIALMATNKIVVYMNDNTASISSTTDYNDGKWHHVVVTYDGTEIALYVDGVPEAYYTITMNHPTYDFVVGNTSDGDASWHLESRAEIDDVAIYYEQILPARVEDHYSAFEDKKGTL